jgi:hypothetical protein
MKILSLRLLKGCHALKGETSFKAGPDLTIEQIESGYRIVRFGKKVQVPHAAVDYAEVEDEEIEPKKYAKKPIPA